MKKKIKKIARLCLYTSVVLFIFNYFFFHYVTDTGFTKIKQLEAGKPFIAQCIGTVACLYLFTSGFLCIYSNVIYKE